jgi:putative endonuclease
VNDQNVLTNNSDLGNKGETIACEHLASKGYKILFRNWRFKQKEIDIIAQFEDQLIIVEVKTRAFGGIMLPKDAVNLKKQRLIIEAANAYIQKHDVNLEVRFDIISILYNANTYKVEHIENAFYPKVR